MFARRRQRHGQTKDRGGEGRKTHYINEEETEEEEGIIVKPGATDLCLMGRSADAERPRSHTSFPFSSRKKIKGEILNRPICYTQAGRSRNWPSSSSDRRPPFFSYYALVGRPAFSSFCYIGILELTPLLLLRPSSP